MRLLCEWAALIVRTEDGDVAVAPSATPGGLACLYQAFCTGCGATYPGPFWVPPAPRHRCCLAIETPIARATLERPVSLTALREGP